MKLFERMMWIFAILFLLCGLPLFFLDKENPDPAAAHALAGMATLFLSAFGLCLAWNALETVEIKVQHCRYSRRGQPLRFIATVALILSAGCGALITAFWFFFSNSQTGPSLLPGYKESTTADSIQPNSTVSEVVVYQPVLANSERFVPREINNSTSASRSDWAGFASVGQVGCELVLLAYL